MSKNKKNISEKKIKFFSKKNLDRYVPKLFFSPHSIFFNLNKKDFFNLFFSFSGRAFFFKSKHPEDQELVEVYNELPKSRTKAEDKKLLEEWWVRFKGGLNQREGFQDRPQNIRVYRTHRIGVSRPHIFLQGDLMESGWLNPDHRNIRYKFCLVLVDMFSSKKYLIPSKSKKAAEIAKILNNFFAKNKYEKFQTDKGGEFLNGQVASVMKQHNITHYTTKSTQKAYMAERAIRSIKEFYNKLIQNGYFEAFIKEVNDGLYNDDDWTGTISYLTNFLNNKKHSRLKFTPNELDAREEEVNSKEEKANVIIRQMLADLYASQDQNYYFKTHYQRYPFHKKGYKTFTELPVGTIVRISKIRIKGTTVEEPFIKPSTAPTTWSNEKYKVIGVRRHFRPQPFSTYKLKNLETGNVISSLFYREELNPIVTSKIKQYYEKPSTYKKHFKQNMLRQKDDTTFEQ